MVSLNSLAYDQWGDLKIEGYIQGKLAATRTLSGSGTDDRLVVNPTMRSWMAMARDATRVVLAVTDAYGNLAHSPRGDSVEPDRPGRNRGENPFSLSGARAPCG